MFPSLYALQTELWLLAADPFNWLTRHDVGPQSQDGCQALGVTSAQQTPGQATPGGSGNRPQVHLHSKDGTDKGGLVTAMEDKPLCGVSSPDDGLGNLILNVAGWLAFILTIGGLAKAAWSAFTRTGTTFGQALKEVTTVLAFGAVLGAVYVVPTYVLPLLGRFFVLVFESIGGLFG